jgi:predicted amidohydrolase YtcJ
MEGNMRRNLTIARRVAILALVGLAPAFLPTPAASQGSARQLDGGVPETILINGKIVTLDARSDIAEAVAIRDGKFLAVGSNRQIEALAGKDTTTIDLKGRTVLPGLIDTHAHLENAGTVKYTVPLGRARSVAEALDLIKAMVGKTKPGDWVRGAGWHPPAQLKERRYLTRQEIDSVAPDNPVFLPTVGHFSMANSYALRLANISRDTPNPLGGEIEKDKNGDPTGLLSESAQHIVAAIVPPYPFDLRVTQLRDAMAYFNSYGITSVVAGAVDPRDFRAYQAIWAKHEMTTRVSAMYLPTGESVPTESLEDWEKFFKEAGVSSGFGDDWLDLAAIGELSTDGGMTLRTAFTRDPYPDDPTFHGTMNTTPERLNQLVAIANRYDWRVGLHAVGDAAVDKSLDAFAYADKEKSIRDRRFILIHGSLMRPDQMARAKALGVRVDVQSTFMWNKAETVARFLGKETADRAVPARSMIDVLGIENVGAGTDYPVNVLDPFVNIYVAVTRKDMNGVVYGKEQAITREEALRLYTISAAGYTFSEARKGSIEPGKFADMVVISDDILTVPDEAIKHIKAVETIVGGKTVFAAEPVR